MPRQRKPPKQEKTKVADISNEISRDASETTDLVDATGQRFNQTAQRGISETLDRAEATGQKLNEAAQRGATETIDRAEASGHRLSQTAEAMFNDMLRVYETFFSFQGAKQIADAYLDVSQRMAKESLDYNYKFVDRWFDGARKLWQVIDEGRREVANLRSV
jgi:ribonucleotide reductase alpha subunit